MQIKHRNSLCDTVKAKRAALLARNPIARILETTVGIKRAVGWLVAMVLVVPRHETNLSVQ